MGHPSLKFLIDTTSGGGDVCALIKETAENFPAADLDILKELIDVGGAVLQLPGILLKLEKGNFSYTKEWTLCFRLGELDLLRHQRIPELRRKKIQVAIARRPVEGHL